MRRREFLRTSSGMAAVLLAPDLWAIAPQEGSKKRFDFRKYRPGRTLGEVTIVTPEDGYYLHTFYDVCPLSPSQRYLAVTRFPYQGRKPRLGDVADVCVIDMQGPTIEKVHTTRAWSYQLGANVQWGNKTDRYLYTNDVIDGRAVCVRLDLQTGETKAFSGPKYDLAPDETFAVGGKLEYINATQYGYAIPDGPSNQPNFLNPEDMQREGLWKTSLTANKTSLLVSYRRFAENVAEKSFYDKDGVFYCFHTKVNSSSTRIMQVIRYQKPGQREGRNASLFTVGSDGNDLIQALSRARWNAPSDLKGSGNHPNWHPDGEHIVMNVTPRFLGYTKMRFCMFKYDGSDFRVLSERHLGSGHPSVSKDGRHLLSDAYPKETHVILKNGEIPIRLIDLRSDEERMVCSVSVDLGLDRNDDEATKYGGSHFKLDPHPAWSRDYKKVCFNAVIEGNRQVLLADLSGIL